MATKRKVRDDGSSEVFRYGGAGTVLLLALLAFVGLHPLFMGALPSRLVGGLVLAIILVAGTIAASRSPVRRAIAFVLAVSTLGLQATWLLTGNTAIEAAFMAMFAAFCLYTALVILRRVLSFGPLYADRVHARRDRHSRAADRHERAAFDQQPQTRVANRASSANNMIAEPLVDLAIIEPGATLCPAGEESPSVTARSRSIASRALATAPLA